MIQIENLQKIVRKKQIPRPRGGFFHFPSSIPQFGDDKSPIQRVCLDRIKNLQRFSAANFSVQNGYGTKAKCDLPDYREG